MTFPGGSVGPYTQRVLTPDESALYSSIGRYFTEGVGADRAYGELRDTGAEIRRQTVRNAYSQFREVLGKSEALTRVKPDRPIPRDLAVMDDSVKTDKVLHKVLLSMVDIATGYRAEQWYTYASDRLEAKSTFMPDLSEDVEPGGVIDSWKDFQIIAAQLKEVRYGPNRKW